MQKLVLLLLAFLAVFTYIRAYEKAPEPSVAISVEIHEEKSVDIVR
jgi:hypothetical protein